MIRVMLVDDSPVVLTLLTRILELVPEMSVVGTARSGGEALRLMPSLEPDVICTDLEMPGMDGFAFIDAVMHTRPCPILVVSNHVHTEDTGNIFRALELGAIDIFPKLRSMAEAGRSNASELVSKIRVLSGVVPLRRSRSSRAPTTGARLEAGPRRQARVVAIGASTGGPQALRSILEALPEPLATPVLCVQHINRDFYHSFIDWLRPVSAMPLRIAADHEVPVPGTVYFPQPDRHLLIDSGRLVNSLDAAVDGHRPSVSATFTSVANGYGASAMGVLLTGMGRDGAAGLLAIAKAGGITVAQDEESSVVFGMAREAIRVGAANHVVPLGRVAELLVRHTAATRAR